MPNGTTVGLPRNPLFHSTSPSVRITPISAKRTPIPIKGGIKGDGEHGFKDKFGNIWTKGSPRTAGDTYEWDVQLSRQGKAQLGWATRDGSHLNVSLKGRITHK